DTIAQIAAISPEHRTPGQAHKLREYYLRQVAPMPFQEAVGRLRIAERNLREFRTSLPTVMVMIDQTTPRPTFVLKRGVYDQPGEVVQAGIPAVFGEIQRPAEAGTPTNRLELANWLIDPRHPLTARVTVNRIWQRLFGTGIVKTSEDFGTQGESPSHPELLDWLATELLRSGWDVKHMHRLMALSAAYRQSSRTTPVMMQADPENRWLARGPRFRMSAEMVRDAALFSSGLLEERLGGP